jgi:Phosphotransferase enzyme family
MTLSVSEFPDIVSLTTGLTSVLSETSPCPVTVLHREAHIYQSTFPSEVVTCRLNNGRILRLFCKYSGELNFESHGHRGGVAYEAEVYRRVLRHAGNSVPRFYGTYADVARGQTWLILQHVDDFLRAHEEPDALIACAQWIGQFHAACEVLAMEPQMAFLAAYDKEYYLGWARRASHFAGPLHRRFAWFDSLCRRFKEFTELLLACRQTVIHGEFYPRNILISHGVVYPVDWESAAVGAGEIDLAAMTEGWAEDVTGECELAYQWARWSGDAPPDFALTLDAARVYLAFRWLGDNEKWTREEGSLQRFEQLQDIGKRWGMV